MSTKQIKVECYVVADDQVSVNATIAVDGIQKWSGDLANTHSAVPDGGGVDTLSYSVAEFDLEVDDFINGQTVYEYKKKNLTFTVTGGTLVIKFIKENYNGAAGDSSDFVELSITEQPTWDGEARIERFYLETGSGPKSGPMPLYAGEVLAFPVYISKIWTV